MYVYKNLNRNIKKATPLMELLNAIGILENLNWKQSYSLYIDVLKQYANGPSDDFKNIRVILKESGYAPVFDLSKFEGRALLRKGNHFYAFMKVGKDVKQFGVVDPSLLEEYLEYDMYIKNYNYSYTREKKESHDKNVNSNQYSYTNLNPNNKYVGDCSIRALASALEVSWYDAVDVLASHALSVNQVYINHEDVVESALSKKGFKKYKYFPVRLTCQEFAKRMDKMFPNSRILVYAGNSHIVALEKNGEHYIIQDTWDSSQELAGCYFVKEENQLIQNIDLLEKIVLHPTFGEGIVEAQEDKKVTIAFEDSIKSLSLDWVLSHCEVLD